MEYKEKRKRSTRFQRLKKIATCAVMIVSIPFLLCSCYVAILIGGLIHASDIADLMPIPYYPDSEFLNDYLVGYSSTVAKVYCSLDPIETVLDYYKDYSPDGNYRHYVAPDKEYQSYSIDYSQSDWFLDFVIWIDDGDNIWRPSWGIYLADKMEKCPQGTLIELSLGVPRL